MTHAVIGFIGAGNMTQAIVGGMIAGGYPAHCILVSNPSQPKLDALASAYGVTTTQDNHQVAEQADVLVLSVKPQIMHQVLGSLFPSPPTSMPLLLSIAAGLPVALLEKMLGFPASIIRAMPNTPCLVGEGITGLFAPDNVSENQRLLGEQIMAACGTVLWVDKEDMINSVIAIAGSSPAYFFQFMDAMMQHAMTLGFTPEQAHKLTVQAAYGSAKMAKQSDQLPDQLKRNVMSKGGATEKAVEAFESAGLTQHVANAMQAAYDRAEEMAKLLDK